MYFGAGEGNRTLVISLEGCCSTIELHPHRDSIRQTVFKSQIRSHKPAGIVCRRHALTASARSGCPPSPQRASSGTSKDRVRTRSFEVVGEVGLEPTKAKPADLQSAPFAARDIPPARRRTSWNRRQNASIRRTGAGCPPCYGDAPPGCQPARFLAFA